MVEYKIPRLLWENLEAVLLAQSKRYISDLAKRLNVCEKELQKRVLGPSDNIRVLIQDSNNESLQCKAYIQQNNCIIYCKKPVAYQLEYCIEHQTSRMNVVMDNTICPYRTIERIKDISHMEPIWIDDKLVINSKGEKVGIINKDTQILKKFIIT